MGFSIQLRHCLLEIENMKLTLPTLMMLILTMTSFAQDHTQTTTLIKKIHNQTNEISILIEEVGRDKISGDYFQKLKESQVALAQLKASQDNTNYDLMEINLLYFAIDRVLNPQKIEINKIKQNKLYDKGVGNATVRGIVTSALTGNVIMTGTVRIYDANGVYNGISFIDNLGRYTFSNLMAGEYALITSINNFIETAQPNIACPAGLGMGCQIEDLPLISIESNQVLEGVDIAVAFKPSISGRVTSNKVANEAIWLSIIGVFDVNGILLDAVFSNISGEYLLTVPQAGDYYVTANHSSYNSELFENVTCLITCDFNSGTLLHLSDNEQLDNVDFTLIPHAKISGSIVDADTLQLLDSGDIHIYNLNEERVNSVEVEYDGTWASGPLPFGEYKIVSRVDDYVVSLYDGLACENSSSYSCNLDMGLPVIHENIDTDNIMLTQFRGAKIRGRIVDVMDQVINSVHVQLYDSDGEEIFAHVTSSDSEGYYESHPVGNGSYYAVATKSNYQKMLYPNIHCPDISSCDFSQGSLLTVNNLTDVDDINFQLNRTVLISGTVVDDENIPVRGIRVYAKDYNLNLVKSGLTDVSGRYVLGGLEFGSYHLYVKAEQGYDPESYDNIPCSNTNCTGDDYTPVVVVTNNIENINFQLSREVDDLSIISGRVVNDDNVPLSNMRILIRKDDNEYGQTITDDVGNYSFPHLPSGSYQLYAVNHGYKPESYDDIFCNDRFCVGDSYTPVIVDLTDVNNVNFKLSRKNQLTINLQSNSTHEIEDGRINVYDDQNDFIRSFRIDDTIELPSGDYYLIYKTSIQGTRNFVSKVYGGNNCFSNCDASTGTLIHYEDNSELVLTMSLDEFFYLDMTSSLGEHADIELYNEDLSFYDSDVFSTFKRYYIRDISSKFLKIKSEGYYSQVYSGIECIDATCDISQGTVIPLQLNSSMSINLDFTPIATISGVITDVNGRPLENVNIVISNDITHNLFSSIKTSATGEYQLPAVADGSYYLKAALPNQKKYATTYYGNITCEAGNCENMNIPVIELSPEDHLTEYNIVMKTRGTISGEGIFNTNNEAVRSAIWFYGFSNESTSLSNKHNVNYDGTLSAVYMQEGNYKVIVSAITNPRIYALYPSTICGKDLTQCTEFDVELSTTFTVTNGSNTHFNHFEIHKRGSIKGQISSESTGLPLRFTDLKLYKASDEQNFISVDVDNNGNYNKEIDNGEYKMLVSNGSYINQLYNNIDCYGGLNIDCTLTQGELITIDYDTDQTINIMMRSNPRIKAKLKNSVTGETINSDIVVFDSDNNQVYNGNEHLHTAYNLLPGSYFVMAMGGSEYPIIGYPDVECTNIDSVASCELPLSPIELSVSQNLQEIDIYSLLNQGINGYVIDSSSGALLENVIIDIWDSNGFILGSALTSSSGGFSYILNQGDYYITTDTNNSYINEVYKDVMCSSAAILGECDITQGEQISVPDNNTSPIVLDVGLAVDPIYTGDFE